MFAQVKLHLHNNGVSTGKVQLIVELRNYEDNNSGDNNNNYNNYSVPPLSAPYTPQQYNNPQFNSPQQFNNNQYNQQQQYPLTPQYSAPQQYSSPAKSPTIFDPDVLQRHASQFDFVISLHELDLKELKNAHSFAVNSPFVSAACGKWTEYTSVSDCIVCFVLSCSSSRFHHFYP